MTFSSYWTLGAFAFCCLSVGASFGLVLGAMLACVHDMDVDAK